jgi:putative polyhydroxyalkanoate system protein
MPDLKFGNLNRQLFRRDEMAEIHVRRAHELGHDQAKQSVQAVAEKLKGDLGAKYSWEGDSLRFECPGADGRIDVHPNEVSVSVNLSWLLSAAKGKIERSIEGYLDQYLT